MGMGGSLNIVRSAVPAVPRHIAARWFTRPLLLLLVVSILS